MAGRQISVTASVGITLCPADNADPVALLNNADIAMYQAKEQGRNTFKFFTTSMHEEILSYHRIETDLKNAIAEQQFELLYQPQFGSRTIVSMPSRRCCAGTTRCAAA